MKTENKSVKRLEIGKDYINVRDNNVIVIDRVGDFDNKGFCEDLYKENLLCTKYTNYGNWREATPEEVRERFEAHLVKRYGEDWKTMKIKEEHPSSSPLYGVEITKLYHGWCVWNKNGLIYCEGVWAERLEEEEEEINIKASETQIGGSHYSDMAIQPIEFIHKNNLSFIQGNVIKYVCRYKSKNGVEDLLKAKHYIDLLIEFEEE